MSLHKNQFTFTKAVETGTTIGEIQLAPSQKGVLAFEVSNAGANALSAFKVQIRPHPGAAFYDYLADAAFDTPTDRAIWSSGTIHTTGSGVAKAAIVNVWGVDAVRFVATSVGATVTVRGSIH